LDAVRAVEAEGVGRYLECGPAAVLSVMAAGCVAEDSAGRFVASLPLRKGETDEARALLRTVGALHAAGQSVDWDAVVPAGGLADLPTYAFQRERFWTEASGSRSGDVRAAGLESAGHPWLRAGLSLAGADGGEVFTGRLSAGELTWLADHAVFGTVLVPGTGLLEVALAAAERVGAAGVGELTVLEPLVLRGEEAVRIQVRIGEADTGAGRTVEIHSRPENAPDGTGWALHATGRLLADGEPAPVPAADALAELAQWPVPGAERVELDGLYDELFAQGLEYGPAFRGLSELWRRDGVAYGLVRLPEELDTDGYGVHPALLDAALHTLAAVEDPEAPDGGEHDPAGVLLPFAWSEVALHARGSGELRVRLELTGGTRATVLAADAHGRAVAQVGGLEVRRADAAQLRVDRPAEGPEHLYRVEYRTAALPERADAGSPVAGAPLVIGQGGVVAGLLGVEAVADLGAVLTADAGADVGEPARIVVDLTGGGDPGDAERPEGRALAGRARDAAVDALGGLKPLLDDPRFERTEVVWVTRGAVAAGPADTVDGLADSPLWGLVRVARAEHPERTLRLLDIGPDIPEPEQLARALAAREEPELVLRGEESLTPRLVRAAGGTALELPEGGGTWSLGIEEKGRLDTFAFRTADRQPLPAGHVRVKVRAAGMNFRDVLNALDMVHAPQLGLECSGVVVEAAPGSGGLRPGDRVMGLAVGTFGTEVTVDARWMVRIPDTLGFTEAATLPLAYLTAYYAFHDLGALRAGEKVLVHAAAGGVGTAAVRLARHLGAEVYGTASARKWPALRRLGLDDAHIASSRDAGFADAFLAATGGTGVDLVLNALTGELVDASLRTMPRGGRFLEMGKTDIRDAARTAADHPGVAYQAFDLIESGEDRIQEMLRALVGLLERGAIGPLPYTAFDVREAPTAFRLMAQGRSTGKFVLTIPARPSPDGTALLTGGTGELGRLAARQLVEEHGVRHLVLTSRRGPDTPGADGVVRELIEAGAASVRILACDVSRREDVARIVAEAGAEHPLTAVVHLAAVLDDGVVLNQDAERFTRVLGPKLAGAVHLHELTRHLDLDAFVLFSSAAGTLGAPGQSNYAAANVFLDALAAHRRALGLPGLSLAWGLWQQAGIGMTAGLDEAELGKLRRQGTRALTPEEGLDLLRTALTRPEAHLVPIKLDTAGLQRDAASVPPLLSALVRTRPRTAADAAPGGGLAERLAGQPAAEQLALLLRCVRQEVAGVLGLSGEQAIGPDKPLRELGWDSLTAVELRNRLSALARVPLPSTLTFDYPTPQAIAELLHVRLALGAGPGDAAATADGGPDAAPPTEPLEQAAWALGRITAEQLRHSGLLAKLLELARPEGADDPATRTSAAALQAAEDLTEDEMDRALDAVLGDLA
ncbi:hypothetical protein C6N75_01995, partial [Streptomyces solincola]